MDKWKCPSETFRKGGFVEGGKVNIKLIKHEFVVAATQPQLWSRSSSTCYGFPIDFHGTN